MSSANTGAAIKEEQQQVTLEEALELARGHHQSGNYILADRTYRDILRAVPDHYPTVQLLGVLLYQNGKLEEAAYYFKKALDVSTDDSNDWNNYGAVLTALGRYEEALEAYEKALSITKDHLDSLNNRAYSLWLLGRYEEAEKATREVLNHYPDNLTALINLGLSLAKLEKYDDALLMWERASEIKPEDSNIWANWGNTLREMGRIGQAYEKCMKAVELNPDSPEAQNNLGNVYRDIGRPKQAQECYRIATNLRPDYMEAHNNLAIALIDDSKYAEAVIAARYAIAFKPDFGPAHSSMSVAYKLQGQYPEAFMAAQQAIALDPDKPAPYLDMADVLLMSDRLDDAEATIMEALKREEDTNVQTYAKLAAIYERQIKFDKALEAINKAIEIAPEMASLYLNKATILQIGSEAEQALETIEKALELAPESAAILAVKADILININRNEEAGDLAEKAIEIDPSMPAAYVTLTTLRRINSEDDPRFQKMLEVEKTIESRGLLYTAGINYSISTVYESVKKYDEAFYHLKKANDAKRKAIPYDAEKLPATYERMKHLYSLENLAQFEGAGCDSDVPVFIVGMPRSGTTLTEQIISSHPDVFGAGELPDLGKTRDSFTLSPEVAKEMGEDYVRRIREREKEGKALRITDKMPGNYLQIGLIACILPNAKIIHCRRDPIDTALSCYKQNFARGQYWSYDLEELGAEYLRYLDMMEYWRHVLPGRVLEIDYEETVNNFEEQARKLIDYVGLDWHDACLEPHKQKRAVMTASKAQVTRPIYKTSVQKWKKYEKHLQPLVKIVAPQEALPEEQTN